MSIGTNRLNIDFKIDAIKEDFVFIRLKREKNGKWWGAEELDCIIGDSYKAMSVGYAKYAYAMFEKKSNNTYELLQKLRNDPEFSNVSAIEVKPEAFYSGNDESISEVTLARLLMNSLGSSRSRFKHLQFSNLTGELLKVPPLTDKLSDEIPVAEITLSSHNSQKNEFLLNVRLATYRKKISILKEYRGDELKKILERPEYIFHSGTASLRRCLPSDGKNTDPKKSYIKCSKQGKRLHTNFLEFGSIKEFNSSRSGIFHQVLKNIQEHLSKYMDVNFCFREIESEIPLKRTIVKEPKQLHSILDGQPIHIVDRVNDEDSANLVTTLKELLIPYVTNEKLITSGKREKKGALNFRIIHDQSYYIKNGIEDEYRTSDDKIQRQNLTIESTRIVTKAIVKTAIKEIIIKRDIEQGKFNLFNWVELQSKKLWTFAAWDEESNHVIFMEIQPNGDFKFRKIDAEDLFSYQEYQKYMELMTDSNSGKKIRTLEGIVISDTNDINQIFLTDEITIPDLDKIENILNEIETELPESKQTGDELAEIFQDFLREQSLLNLGQPQSFSDKLIEIGKQPISKKELKDLIATYFGSTNKNEQHISNTKDATDFRDYLLEKHQIRLKFPQDNQSKEDLFDASINIKYFGETEKEAYYFVGDRRDKIQFSFKDACHLRKIVAVNDSKLIFRQILPTMDVDFVRTGQSTVIPFPFKYIREYKNSGVAQLNH
ncbi:hypothetical protein [Limnofasciculus baicalensis]|uniref:Uncharacterized protein n=1 Tax=Limnofasciculus baicalensis BBK-W-15 TaxID=2699891 RepID=A0AAE3KQD9_9CYAN|nr:hypothetical protein [Limnofasciculus baicalensis]MCP2730603.1 hypothetical protein [Limnofasciculus baicalensis BBK-W-15]